ncbi:MAG: ornithine cyclodeaminase family protein [Candidatus Atribacteria bacterium]|nr:MAG: ornithine cyclodeaminase family protein [Candidatus Atribacteria bacterium]
MANYPTAILSLPTIKEYLLSADLIPLIEQGFVALSSGQAIVPPVGEILFDNPKGETHIKYGYIKHQAYYIVKIASGFYENPKIGIKSSQGVMLLFSQQTGELLAVLLDEGYLTDIRTVIASMITLKYLAPKKVECVGIIGTGIQAQLQLEFLNQVCNCTNIMVWGRNKEKTLVFKEKFKNTKFSIEIASTIDELAENCSVIITTTPSIEPLLEAGQIKAGTHITAIGSDTSEKVELSSEVLKKADLVVSDSIAQSHTRGEVFQARKNNCLDESKLIELGNLIQNPNLGRSNEHQITVADLTGVAVQDIMIATAIFNHHNDLKQ